MKKLLLLGGTRYLVPVILRAKELGYYTITCDYLPNNISHKYSDEYHNVSIIEKDKVLELAKCLKIDGVMSFACDPGVVTAAYVAEQLNLPSCGPYESVCILQNKSRFREFLKNNGFNVPTAKGYISIEDALEDVDLFHWPVIVKPTDSAGSKGVSKVENPALLRSSIENALSYSFKKEFIIEDFIEKQGFASDSDCFSVNGNLKVVSFSSQRFDEKAENPYTPAAYSWPSTFSDKSLRELTSELQRLISLLGMKSSIYNVETRESINGKAYIMEVSPRAGGNRLSEMIAYASGTDLISATIRAAMGEEIGDIKQNPINGNWAEVILHGKRPGIFHSLWISEEIKDNVVEEDLWISPGRQIGGFKAANEAIGTLVLRFETSNELEKVMQNVDDYVQVKVK